MSLHASGDVGNSEGTSHCARSQWFKVVLLGEARVGKTSLVKALKNDVESCGFSKEYKPTTGAWITHYDLTDGCELLITDTSGRQEFTPLVNLYLRKLHCVAFVFALDEPSSFKRLIHWYKAFTQAYTGDASKVAKFVVGTKTDVAHDSAGLQTEATSFAEKIGAEIWITSAAKSFNTHELFTRIAENVSKIPRPPSEKLVTGQSDFQDGRAGDLPGAYMLDDVFVEKGALIRYPDPVLLDTNGEEISDILLSHHCLTMMGQNRTFKWGTEFKKRSKEAVMRESSKTSSSTRGTLWSCVMANTTSSTWQNESLEGVIKYGTTIRRQPTKTEFKNIKKMLFSTRDKLGCERNHGLFYMLLQTEDDSLSEVGLNSVFDEMNKTTSTERLVVKNNFHCKPTPLPGRVSSVSMSCSHAALVGSDNQASVSTWGHRDKGALGLEQHLISNFDPPLPTPVTSVNCQIKQVACGADFTLMLTMEGLVYSCGSGAFGKLGHGDEGDKALPTLIETLKNIQTIAAGSDHAAAIAYRGWLYQWGLECADEQLTRFVATPKVMGELGNITLITVKSISCGSRHTVLAGDGRWYSGIPYAWGKGSHGRLGMGNRRNFFSPGRIHELYNAGKVVTQVSAGGKHTAFLTKDGEVYACGSNAFGQLGYFTASGDSDVPRKVFLGKNTAGDEIRAKELCCNEDCTMVLTKEGEAVVWGKCYYGSKLEDPVPMDLSDKEDVHINDVTTCNIQSGESFVELVVALTNGSSLLFCAGVKSDSDCQAADDTTPLISCTKTNLTTLCSVESVLVSMDKQGNAYYADLGSWVSRFLHPLPEGKIVPDDVVHALFSKLKEQLEPDNLPPVDFIAIPLFRGSIMAIEASLSTFLFCSRIGDVYSWSPVVGGHLMHHKELNSEIIVQIACGAKHFAALSAEGTVFTCGDGRSGQLGCGTFESAQTFQVVPLAELDRVRTVCCGWASTSVVTENGKVYFWGQLDFPRREKINGKQLTIPSPTAPFDFAPRVKREENVAFAPAGYQVKITSDAGTVEHHLAVVGRPLEIEIIPRDGNTDGTSRMEFRAETINLQDQSQIHSKGTIKKSHTTDGAYVASVVFHSKGSFNFSITRNGQNVLGSPLKVNAERGVMITTCKLSLIGSDIECVRVVGGALQQAINARDQGIELWGVPSITADLVTHEALQLASMTDGGIYIYVWDANCGNLAEENLNFWLHQLSLFAPSSNVILLGVNLSASHANEIDLKPFQKVNPQLKRSIFAGTTFTADPGKLLDEVLLVTQETTSCQGLVWHRFENLVSRVVQKKKAGVEILDEATFKCLAGECGIHRESLSREAAEHLEMIGIGLVIRGETLLMVLQPNWLARQLTEIAKSSHSGAVDRNILDTPQRHVANLLISKRLALERRDRSTIAIVPFLSSIPEESWSLVDGSRYTIYRHLILTVPPYYLHSMFKNLAASVLQEFNDVSLGRYSLVIHNDQYQSRIDCGPCVVNKTVAEVRVTVRANNQDICSKGAEATVGFLLGCCEKLGTSCKITVKASCSVCRQYYIDLTDVQEAATKGDIEHTCGRCYGNKLSVGDLLNGFKEARAAVELNWRPFHSPLQTGSPHSKPDISPSDTLLRPLMRYFGDREERHGAQLVKEIKGMFQNMTKVFADMKNYDVPRTVCILPEFQRASVLKSSAIKRLLTFGQPKFRLFLLCEGNGDGTGVHFLDYSKHQGYKLEKCIANDFVKETAEILRFTLQLLLPSCSAFSLAIGMGLFDVKNVEKTIGEVLGVVGLSGAMLCAVPWKNVFKQMDDFVKGIQESAGSIRDPKGLSELSGAGIGHHLGGETYLNLRKYLCELGAKDDFGGLRQEPRDGIGAIWVCEKHSMYSKNTTSVKVMP